MTPLEMAMKLASASSRCKRHVCPFMGQCKGEYETCTMKEIALMLRSQNAAIESQNSMIKCLYELLGSTQVYISELEKINKMYHDIVVAFNHGYRPKKVAGRKRGPTKKQLKDPVSMDGIERFAYEPPSDREPEPPVVVL